MDGMAADAIEMKGTNPMHFCNFRPFFIVTFLVNLIQSNAESKDGKFIVVKKCLI